ncbi:hypothetical protein KO361_03625, partial [Candidatus Woesearchaeota archaeon]|nr:hypothetical protein [Candidatus Woesearchaeota archaeon]
MNKKKIKSLLIFIAIILLSILTIVNAQTASFNTQIINIKTGVSQVVSDSDGKVLGTYIDVNTSFDICLYDDFRRVVNSRNDQIFIPSNTSEEWSAFLSETPSGVALN